MRGPHPAPVEPGDERERESERGEKVCERERESKRAGQCFMGWGLKCRVWGLRVGGMGYGVEG